MPRLSALHRTTKENANGGIGDARLVVRGHIVRRARILVRIKELYRHCCDNFMI